MRSTVFESATGARTDGTGRSGEELRDEMDAYERLLTEAMRGDALLFVREDAVEAAWAVVDPILDPPGPVHEYDPGTWGSTAADHLAADVGGWHNPDHHQPGLGSP